MTQLEEKLHASFGRLSEQEQQKVVEFAQALETGKPRGAKGSEIMHLAGTLSDEDAAEMMKAIEEGCGQIDYDGWDNPPRF